VIDLILEKLR